MRLIVTGCEYAGKTTLIREILKWFRQMNVTPVVHDHFTFPSPPTLTRHDEWDPADVEKIMHMTDEGKKRIARWGHVFHMPFQPAWGVGYGDVIYEGFYFEDLVYGKVYYGYKDPASQSSGPPDDGADFVKDTTVKPGMKHIPYMYSPEHASFYDSTMMSSDPNTILLLMEASPEIIAKRMREAPHEPQRIKEEDIDTLIEMFRKEVDNSLLVNRMLLDTSIVTPEETFEQFKKDVTQYLTEKDMLRIILHHIRKGNASRNRY
jgi:hypothetical protein